MKVDGRELKRALSVVKPAVSRRKGGIFDCVRLQSDAAGKKLTVTADDCYTRIECVIPCDGAIDALVKYADLAPWVQAGEILMERIDGNSVRLQAWDYDVSMTLVSDDVAVVGLPNVPVQGGIILSDDDLAAIASLQPMCATDESRAIITNIYMDGAECAGTDTHRLGVVRLDKDLGIHRFIPPEIVKLARRGLGPFTMRWGDGRIQINTADHSIRWTAYVSSDGMTYPNYNYVIPKPELTTLRLTMSSDLLRAALSRLTPVADSKRICVQLRPDSALLSCSYSGGQAFWSLPAKIETDDEPKRFFTNAMQPDWHVDGFAVNGRYLLDGLKFIGAESVCLELNQKYGPVTLRSGDRTYILMPMHVD